MVQNKSDLLEHSRQIRKLLGQPRLRAERTMRGLAGNQPRAGLDAQRTHLPFADRLRQGHRLADVADAGRQSGVFRQ